MSDTKKEMIYNLVLWLGILMAWVLTIMVVIDIIKKQADVYTVIWLILAMFISLDVKLSGTLERLDGR